jgi:hypothetical protein
VVPSGSPTSFARPTGDARRAQVVRPATSFRLPVSGITS